MHVCMFEAPKHACMFEIAKRVCMFDTCEHVCMSGVSSILTTMQSFESSFETRSAILGSSR